LKILILYFSGTGNTKFIGCRLARSLTRKGFSVKTASTETFEPRAVERYDYLVFGFPVYGWDIPGFLKSYISDTRRGLSLFSTIGYNGGNSR